jgi:2-(1,2-epoxy-1,2-dihydrophenyl)acetyl-CoA isomerase
MDFETLEFEVRGAVAHVTLAREQAANALDLRLCQELFEAALRCQRNPAVRAVVIGAKGRMFCAGGDLQAMAAAGDAAPALLRRMTLHLHGAIALFARMDAPVVAAVSGTAAGAGFSLVCACDLAVAAESAKFTMAYTRAGLTPDGSSTWFLPRLVGRKLELMLGNRLLSAAEALDWGLVNRVVPDVEVAQAAEALARELAAGATRAYGTTKRLVLGSASESLETQMELEAEGIAAAAATRDGREGIAAFLAKRAPGFVGE